MAVFTVPLADRNHSGVTQIRFASPETLLEDGRIIHFLSRLTTRCTGGRSAWELLFTSQATPAGTALDARLITHTSVPAAQRPTLTNTALGTREKLLDALQQNDIAAEAVDRPLPTLNGRDFIALCKPCPKLIGAGAFLTPGQLRQRLCTQPGNGVSLVLVQSDWADGELAAYTRDETPDRQAMLARDPVFRFVVTVWGPDAPDNAAWLQRLTHDSLAPAEPRSPAVYPACVRHDPWHLMTLVPNAAPLSSLLTLSELLTLCGCPAEPGEMQQMSRVSWRERAAQSLKDADISLLAVDMPLQEEDLRYMGLNADSDLETALNMSPEMCDMLRMCAAILRRLGVLHRESPTRDNGADDDRAAHLTGLLLPAVGHIYEQFVRECCYKTMYRPYYPYVTGEQPSPVSGVLLNMYDIGPDCRERMTADFTFYATIDGHSEGSPWWRRLFSDMYTARKRRNDLTHEKASLHNARRFAEAFLLESEDRPSLLRRLLLCRRIATNFPPSAAENA